MSFPGGRDATTPGGALSALDSRVGRLEASSTFASGVSTGAHQSGRTLTGGTVYVAWLPYDGPDFLTQHVGLFCYQASPPTLQAALYRTDRIDDGSFIARRAAYSEALTVPATFDHLLLTLNRQVLIGRDAGWFLALLPSSNISVFSVGKTPDQRFWTAPTVGGELPSEMGYADGVAPLTPDYNGFVAGLLTETARRLL